MQILVRPRHLYLHIRQAAQPARDRGGIHRYHRCVRHQYYIGREQLFVVGAELVEARRTDLLLALKHEFHVARQRIGRAHRLERLGVHKELPFVVIRAAPPYSAVRDRRLERLGAPLFARIDGHNVVMTVNQHRFGRWVDYLFGVHHGIALGGHDIGTIGARLHERGRQPLGATLHVRLVLRLRADRRYPQQFEQFVEKTIAVYTYIIMSFFHIVNY